MIARIDEHNQLPNDLGPAYVSAIRAFLATRASFRGSYQLLEPKAGHALSLILGNSSDHAQGGCANQESLARATAPVQVLLARVGLGGGRDLIDRLTYRPQQLE